MGWKIPTLPNERTIKSPSILRWGIGLLLLIGISTTSTIFLFRPKNDLLFWFCALLLPSFLWLIAFASLLFNYLYTQIVNENIRKSNQQITRNWQNWSKQQVPVFGHYFISAEPDALTALTSEDINIPLFPSKARPLFIPNTASITNAYWFLEQVHLHLIQQCCHYQNYLSHIYLPKELMEDDDLVAAIFAQWDLKPEPIDDYAVLMTKMHDNTDPLDLSLLLVCQYNDKTYSKHSKFISALLVGDKSLTEQADLKAKAWLGRLMDSAQQNIANDLHQLCSYNQLEPQTINDIWLSGFAPKASAQLTLVSYQLNIGIEQRDLIHNIDLTFAQPTTLTKYLLVTMASCYSENKSTPQLTIVNDQQQLYLQLVTANELFANTNDNRY